MSDILIGLPPGTTDEEVRSAIRKAVETGATVLGSRRLKAMFTVQAGVVPGHPEDQYTKRWVYTDADMEHDAALPPMPEGHKIDMFGSIDQPHVNRWTACQMQALQYHASLMNPSSFNWTESTWMWV